MKFPLTVAHFAEWAENNRQKRFKIRQNDRRTPDGDEVEARSNSCPLATCLKHKKLAGAYTEVDGATFAPDKHRRPEEACALPNWASEFVTLFDSEDTESFTGAQILRIIKDGDLCTLEKTENETATAAEGQA